jgi:hypothetical protein
MYTRKTMPRSVVGGVPPPTYSYQKCIELGKQDLIKYPKKQLYQLGRVMGLPLDIDHSELAENIAVKLIDRHWAQQRGNMTKEELPYGGDISKARDRKDIPAIRQIQAWIDAQQSERSSQNVAEDAERQVPEEAADCENNTINYITQKKWSENNPPEVKITLWDSNDPIEGPKRTICFRRDELQQWLADQSHRMAPWIPNLVGGVIDDDGHGGGPSAQMFTQLPERTLVFGGPEFNEDNWIGIPTATDIRVGNRVGSLGVGELHGQVPGKVVYTVFPLELSNHQEIFGANFVRNLQLRTNFGGIMLLGQILTGKNKLLFVDIFNKTIADSIVFENNLNWHDFIDITEKIKLISDTDFKEDILNLNDIIEYVTGEQAAAEKLREIFLKLSKMKQHIPDNPEYDEDKVISDVYNTIVEKFYSSDRMADRIHEKLLPELSFYDVIKASQRLWDTYPAMDQDYNYDYDGQRVGPGIAYQSDNNEDDDILQLLDDELVQLFAPDVESTEDDEILQLLDDELVQLFTPDVESTEEERYWRHQGMVIPNPQDVIDYLATNTACTLMFIRLEDNEWEHVGMYCDLNEARQDALIYQSNGYTVHVTNGADESIAAFVPADLLQEDIVLIQHFAPAHLEDWREVINLAIFEQ